VSEVLRPSVTPLETLTVYVEVLFPGVGSTAPDGELTVAVLLTVPTAEGLIVAVRTKVALPFTSKLTVVLMFPVPLAAPQTEPAVAVQVHDPFKSVAGSVSTTRAPTTALGPLLVATIE
jgi:hypothetical protein